MLVRITPNTDNTWTIFGLSGEETYNKTIGQAEMVRLQHARLTPTGITGRFVACHGFVPNEDFSGIFPGFLYNKIFRECHRKARRCPNTGGWFDEETLGDLNQVHYLTVSGEQVYFSRKQDIQEDRKTLVESVEAPPPLPPSEPPPTLWGRLFK